MSTQEQETEGADARRCLTLRIIKDSGIQRGMGGNNLTFIFKGRHYTLRMNCRPQGRRKWHNMRWTEVIQVKDNSSTDPAAGVQQGDRWPTDIGQEELRDTDQQNWSVRERGGQNEPKAPASKMVL